MRCFRARLSRDCSRRRPVSGYVPPEALPALRAKLKPLLGTGQKVSVSFIDLSGGFTHQVQPFVGQPDAYGPARL